MQKFLNLEHLDRYHLTSPSSSELNWLMEQFDLHEIIEEDLVEKSTQDKVDVYDQYLFVVLHIPKYNKDRGKYVLNEFKIILWKEFIVTIASRETAHFEKVKDWYIQQMDELEDDEQYKLSPYYVLYKIIDVMHDKVLRGLRYFGSDLRVMEEAVFDESFNTRTVADMSIKRRNVVTIKHGVLPQKEIIEELQAEVVKKLWWTKLEVYFEDLQYKIDKIMWNMSILAENIDSLYDAFDAMMTTKTNTNIMMLTTFTVILWVLTLVTGFYGMNVDLPGQELAAVVYFIIWCMVFFAAGMRWWLKRKKWM